MHQQPTSLWDASAETPRFAPLREELRVDVAIVGAGITGITAALLLAENGRRVAVVEKETVTGGDAGNSTAHITEAIDARYHYIRRHYSKEEAKLVADATRASIGKIAELVQRFSIDCHFQRVPGYLYTEKRRYVAELKNEASAAREAGLDAEYVNDVPLPFETRGAVLWPNQARFHPHEYVAALAGHAAAAGARIFERTPATRIEPGVVETENGRLTADHVFVATDELPGGVAQAGIDAVPGRTYAIAFADTGAHPEGLFRDTADPYHSIRWQETREETFLIVGGEDQRAGEEEDAPGAFERLGSYARQYFGERPERFRWSGRILEPPGGLPLIGRAGDVCLSTGYGRQGMTFGTAGAMVVADLILGVPNPWAGVFDPMRSRPQISAKQFVTDNLQLPIREDASPDFG